MRSDQSHAKTTPRMRTSCGRSLLGLSPDQPQQAPPGPLAPRYQIAISRLSRRSTQPPCRQHRIDTVHRRPQPTGPTAPALYPHPGRCDATTAPRAASASRQPAPVRDRRAGLFRHWSFSEPHRRLPGPQKQPARPSPSEAAPRTDQPLSCCAAPNLDASASIWRRQSGQSAFSGA